MVFMCEDSEEKTFEEEFPSLKGMNFLIDDRISINHIQKYCLDKQRVREAIENHLISGVMYTKAWKNSLFKELGLDEVQE